MDHLTQLCARLQEAASASPYAEKKLVFGDGCQNPRLMMIGEAPGGDEEKQGRPFVGKAGKNLSAFLETIGLKREEIYISNVVKLRPTKESPKTGKAVNRPPSKDEIAFFLPFLQEEIKVVNPQCDNPLGIRLFPSLPTGRNQSGESPVDCHIGQCTIKSGDRRCKSSHWGLARQAFHTGGRQNPLSPLPSRSHHLQSGIVRNLSARPDDTERIIGKISIQKGTLSENMSDKIL